MKTITLLAAALCLAAPQADPVRYVDSGDGVSAAVIVDQASLVHTAQLLPLDAEGRLEGKDPESQISRVLQNLEAVLQKARSGMERLVKVNVYAAREDVVPAVQRAFAKRFTGSARPAVTFAVGRLRLPEALVAMDAVAATDLKEATRTRTFAVLPPGPCVYVSGEAGRGPMPEAAQKTLETLRDMLTWQGLTEQDIVQVKVFLTPASSIGEVEKIIASFFGESSVPPLVFVEWVMPLPIEIELIARAPSAPGREVVEYFNPHVKSSPIYTRVVRVNRGKTIYISGLYGRKATSGEAEILEIFDVLKSILEKTGSDFRHLVKATYYPTTEETSRKLGELRPRFYDPRRPPAASKAVVQGVGMAAKTITLDMIAVESRP
jgi:enamine deaminase RidA (YjgF/YER057c/UK114 family)